MMRTEEIGFVVTPQVIADRVAAINAAVAALDADVRRSSSPKLDTAWRAEWAAFTRRWQVERDSRAGWTSRLFAWEAMPRIDAYQGSYNWWARDFQKRTQSAPTVPAPADVETFTMSIVPTPVWWLGGAALVYWLIKREI